MSEQDLDAEISIGREVPYSQLGDWVNHSGVSDRAARVYWTLSEHLNIKRGDREVWPAQNTMTKILGIKRVADVAPAIDELVVIGAVEIRTDYEPTGRRGKNRYIVHGAPADGYVGPRSLAEFYKLLQVDDGARYDEWFARRRAEIKRGVERLRQERSEADRRAKERAKRRALEGAGSRTTAQGAESRTSTPPASTQESPGEGGVRDSAQGGAGFRTSGVRDSAPEQDVVEQDEEEGKDITSVPATRTPDPANERADVKRVCKHLADRIEGNGCKRPSVTKKWLDSARLLIDKDGRTEEQVHAAIDWCQNNDFWRANILSMPKLREKYDQLRLQAQREAASGNVVRLRSHQQETDDLFDRAMDRAGDRMQEAL